MNKYIYKVNLLVSDDIENLTLQNDIDTIIENAIHQLDTDVEIEIISYQINDLNENDNFGKCVQCGAWVSDKRYNNKIDEFSNGACLECGWLCDLCLPKNHKNHF